MSKFEYGLRQSKRISERTNRMIQLKQQKAKRILLDENNQIFDSIKDLCLTNERLQDELTAAKGINMVLMYNIEQLEKKKEYYKFQILIKKVGRYYGRLAFVIYDNKLYHKMNIDNNIISSKINKIEYLFTSNYSYESILENIKQKYKQNIKLQKYSDLAAEYRYYSCIIIYLDNNTIIKLQTCFGTITKIAIYNTIYQLFDDQQLLNHRGITLINKESVKQMNILFRGIKKYNISFNQFVDKTKNYQNARKILNKS